MEFSQIVKIAREELSMSQEELARALNVSFATVNRWENGKTHPNQLTKNVFFNFCIRQKIKIDDIITCNEKNIRK